MHLGRRVLIAAFVWVCSALLPVSAAYAGDAPRRPNVVLIMTDNQGAWTLGCYGNPEIRTPHIDRLAAEGVRFSRAYSSNSVCSPTRATFLTGLMPSQHGVHCWLRGGNAQMGPKAYNTIAEFRSLPEILAETGYVCGLSGKWHLGDNLHPQDGFTYWYTKPHGHTTTFYGAKVIWQGKVIKEPRYLTTAFTDHAVTFMEQNRDRPFFLFLAYNGPYGLGGSFLKPHKNRHTAYYADKPMRSFPREPMHPWLTATRNLYDNITVMRGYAAAISGVDDGVGRVMETLKRLGLDENTLVIFTADQGLCGGHHGMWGMGDHSRPLHTFEETIHIPLIFRHPGRIRAGHVADEMVCNYDLLPSVLAYLGLADKIPTDRPLPGRNFAPVLTGKAIAWDNVIFHEFENTRMIRTAEWKYTHRHPDGPHELYDMRNDPGERTNLAGRTEHADIQAALKKRLDAFFARYADPKYDLWRGGTAKSHRLVKK